MDFGETRRHQRDKTPRWCRREHATAGADQDPGTSSRHLSSEGRPQLAVSGSSWGPARCVVASSLDDVWSLATAGAQETGACSRLSLPVPGPRGGRGHTCRIPPRACSVSNATSQSIKCQASTLSTYTEQQRLRYVRCWSVPRIGGRRAATTA